MKKHFKILFFLILFATTGYAQKGKLVETFKLGNVGYKIYETSFTSGNENEGIYFKLYRVGNDKAIVTAVKQAAVKATPNTLISGNYRIEGDKIIFQLLEDGELVTTKHYTQNSKGLLFLSKDVDAARNAVAEEPTRNIPTVASPPRDANSFGYVDVVAEYPGGINEARKFMANNVVIPDLAVENNVNGIVIAKFVVEADGAIGNIEIVKSMGYGCDEEVIRVLKKMPKWSPAQLRGKPVRSTFRFPVAFQVSD